MFGPDTTLISDPGKHRSGSAKVKALVNEKLH